VAFSLDGKPLAAGWGVRGGGGVVLWEVAGRRRLSQDPLPVKEGEVSSVAFSPDGKTLAAGCGGVVLWEVSGWRRLSEDPLRVKEGGVSSVAFRPPDGKTLAAGYVGGVVLCDVDLKSWQRIAGRIANRNLTRAEWHQYLPDEPYRRLFRILPWPYDLSQDERTEAEGWENKHPEENDAL
jgi:WD40 repeat protein